MDYIYIYIYTHTNPFATQGQFFKRSLTGWILSFHSPKPVAIPRLKSPVCPIILPIGWGRIVGFIPFPKILELCKIKTAPCRIWTQFHVSISYNNIHNTTCSSYIYIYIYIYICIYVCVYIYNENFRIWWLLWQLNIPYKNPTDNFFIYSHKHISFHFQEDNKTIIKELFPFTKFFSNAPQPLFSGESYAKDLDIAEGCFRHIKKIFTQLEVSMRCYRFVFFFLFFFYINVSSYYSYFSFLLGNMYYCFWLLPS